MFMYRFNIIPMKISTSFFVETDKLIIKFIWKYRTLRIAETKILNKNKVGGITS
jgi:hypothetical protein